MAVEGVGRGLVVGTAAQAEEVRAGYRAAGRAPTPLEEDRLIAGAWYFYLGS
jgi:hypothetical protein